MLPQLVLDVEMGELGITAGLQDRVIQVRVRVWVRVKAAPLTSHPGLGLGTPIDASSR